MWGWAWHWGHGAYGFPFWLLAGGFRLLVLAAIVVGVVSVVRHVTRRGRWGDHHEETALDILQKRYARGEITKEEYEEMKRNLS